MIYLKNGNNNSTMKLSACDIGNPIYNRSKRTPDGGQGTVEAKVFTAPDDFEVRDVDYEWEETPDGIDVIATKPRVANANDLEWDVRQSIEEDLRRPINHVTWTN